MNVVLVHPVHGAKVAINEQEIKLDEENGWTRHNPDIITEEIEKTTPIKRNKGSRKSIEVLNEQLDKIPDFLTSVNDELKEN